MLFFLAFPEFFIQNVLFLDNNINKYVVKRENSQRLFEFEIFFTQPSYLRKAVCEKMSDENAKKIEEKASDSEEVQSNEEGENVAKDVNNKKKKKKRRSKGKIEWEVFSAQIPLFIAHKMFTSV